MNTPMTAHVPVMTDQVLAALRCAGRGRFLDCTGGGGGHAQAMLDATSDNIVVIADRDRRAIERIRHRLSRYENRAVVLRARFSQLVESVGGQVFDGLLADLGVSTDQLSFEDGFAFSQDSNLDMRMEDDQETTAATLLNECSAHELLVLFREGGVRGDLKGLIAGLIERRPWQRTGELAAFLAERRQRSEAGRHPATVFFQALRMAVNREREELQALLEAMPTLLRAGGRAAVITFHSLEDEIVTKQFRQWASRGEFSALGGGVPTPSRGVHLTPKPTIPGEAELAANPAARSARLRVFEFFGE